MNLRLALEGALAPCMRRRMLDELVRVTAEGFAVATPEWGGRSFDARLAEYARFTALQAEILVAAGDGSATEAAKERLRCGAGRLGASLRRVLGIRRPEDAFAALKLLYRQIGIDVSCRPAGEPACGTPAGSPGAAPGEMTVDRCFFACYYNEPVCRVVEALDQGLVAGLFDGARLEFSERLTGGRPYCRARLQPALEER